MREPSILSLKTFSNLQLCLFVGFGEISQGNDFTNWYCTNIRGKKNFYFVLTCYKAWLSVYTNSLKKCNFLKNTECIFNTFSFFFFFKQKTAYEIASCLVGSEMCIRDRNKGYCKKTFYLVYSCNTS